MFLGSRGVCWRNGLTLLSDFHDQVSQPFSLRQTNADEFQAELPAVDPAHDRLIDAERPFKIIQKQDNLKSIPIFISTDESALHPFVDTSRTVASPSKSSSPKKNMRQERQILLPRRSCRLASVWPGPRNVVDATVILF
jgi:hypothetical protein